MKLVDAINIFFFFSVSEEVIYYSLKIVDTFFFFFLNSYTFKMKVKSKILFIKLNCKV